MHTYAEKSLACFRGSMLLALQQYSHASCKQGEIATHCPTCDGDIVCAGTDLGCTWSCSLWVDVNHGPRPLGKRVGCFTVSFSGPKPKSMLRLEEESINWNQLFSFHYAEGLQHDRTLIFRLCPGCLTAAATWHVHVPALEVLSKEFPNLSEAAVTLLSFAAQKGVLCPLPIGHNADGLH